MEPKNIQTNMVEIFSLHLNNARTTTRNLETPTSINNIGAEKENLNCFSKNLIILVAYIVQFIGRKEDIFTLSLPHKFSKTEN